MIRSHPFIKGVFTILLIAIFPYAFSCSMYKVSSQGRTMVGNNEDSWGRDASIWFEPGTKGAFGVVCVGYARKFPHPDGAMNEHGLVFDAFTMRHRSNMPERNPHKKDFSYSHIKTIMQQCKTVDEVYTFLQAMNLHVLNGSPIFNGGMLLFVDKSGKYMVVEAHQMTLGQDDKFALANFSVADTKDFRSIKTERYRKGILFLNNKKTECNLAYCKGLSDTMAVQRVKVGDGTLYTSIYDLQEGLVHLYFFHDFDKGITFNLKEELSKGPHIFQLEDLFPANKKYQKFLNYQTPQNNKTIFGLLITIALLLFFSTCFFLIHFFRSATHHFKYLKLILSALSLVFCFYTGVLLTQQSIFYFPAPHYDETSIIISMSGYLPVLLLIILFPLWFMMSKVFGTLGWNKFTGFLFAANNIAYSLLLGFFMYWEMIVLF